MWSTSELTGELYFMLMYVKISNCMPEVCTLCHMSQASTNVPERGQEHRTGFQEVLRQHVPCEGVLSFPDTSDLLAKGLAFHISPSSLLRHGDHLGYFLLTTHSPRLS